MVRAIGGPADPASRVENRVGEPAANPYLYMASQIVAGLDGVDNDIDPGPMSDEPYGSDRPLLPTTLMEAVAALKGDSFFRGKFGDALVDYVIKLKEHETTRFLASVEDSGSLELENPTDWEQREYFRFY
jgi:glutamine synthetase